MGYRGTQRRWSNVPSSKAIKTDYKKKDTMNVTWINEYTYMSWHGINGKYSLISVLWKALNYPKTVNLFSLTFVLLSK